MAHLIKVCGQSLTRNIYLGKFTRILIILQTVIITFLCLYVGLLSNKTGEFTIDGDKKTRPHDVPCQEILIGRKESTGMLPLCPCIPPNLKGRLQPKVSLQRPTWTEIFNETGTGVKPGGFYKPPTCLARFRVAIVIPFRDRELHLRILLRHLYPILKRQQLEFRIFVIEQNLPVVFNKASMMNIGYLEVGKLWPDYDCVVFHDVDMIMENDKNLFRCGEKPIHMGAFTDKFKYRVIYSTMFGGVVSFTKEQFYLVNGFSNTYFGWGGEDDDMHNRVKAKGLTISRPGPEIARYTQLKHERDGGNPVNRYRVSRNGAYNLSPEKYKKDGVKQILYEVLESKQRPLFTWIHVNLDTSNLNFTMDQEITFYNYTKIVGRTCKGDDIGTHFVSIITCRFYCDRKLTCAGFVYNSKDQQCYLKYYICEEFITKDHFDMYMKDVDQPLFRPSKHIYTKFAGDCPGGDIGGYLLTNEDCEASCDSKDECVAYQFSESLIHPCWLKKRCERKLAKAGLTLFIKGPVRENGSS